MKNNLTIIIIAVVAVLIIAGGIGFFVANQYATSPPQTEPETTPETGQPEQEFPAPGGEDIPEHIVEHSITIDNFAFSPSTLTISVGDIVTWTNMQGVSHTVTSDSGNELDSELLSNGETYSHTFSTAGTYAYHCTPHPSMKGTIIVN